MTWRIDSPDTLAGHLRSLGPVQAPVRTPGGALVWEELQGSEDIDLSVRTDVSARGVFQPPTHYFLHFDVAPGAEPEFSDMPSGMRTVLGLRPCDLAALSILDSIFSESGSYMQMRSNLLLVGYLCDTRVTSCFCEVMGGSPGERSGMDLVLYRGEDGGLYLDAVSQRGTEVMDGSGIPECSGPPPPVLAETAGASGLPEDIGSLLSAADESVWDEVSFPCVNCRVCTYVCPTCHCFTLTDEVFGDRGARGVVWDSCQSREFTQEASGHNPRESGKSRVRQRIMHKFHWYPVQTGGGSMCSGCGRCISGCPTGRSILEDLAVLAGEV